MSGKFPHMSERKVRSGPFSILGPPVKRPCRVTVWPVDTRARLGELAGLTPASRTLGLLSAPLGFRIGGRFIFRFQASKLAIC